MKEEILALQYCAVLITPEGGAGAFNMFLRANTVLITIDFVGLSYNKSVSLESEFFDRLYWLKHERYQYVPQS
jgi:hypothetical protein